jgi:hypothetical protein
MTDSNSSAHTSGTEKVGIGDVTALTCERIARSVLGEPTKRSRAELLWHCPNHQDAHESLSLNPTKNVFLCAPCGAAGTPWQLAAFLGHLDPSDKPAVTAWLKDHGLLNGDADPPKEATNRRGSCVATYVYRDATGNVARKLRFEPGANGRKKEFAWQRWEDGAWVDGLAGLKLPLYRLPEIQSEAIVILTEGEKDADAGARIGLPTSTSGGVGSFRAGHGDTLRNKHVVIVADADDAGREHAQRVAAVLHRKAASVKVCEIQGSKDLAEAIDKGAPADFLRALFEDAPEWKPVTGAEILDSVLRFLRRFVSLTAAQVRVVTLWAAHTFFLEAVDCTPYLSINSAEKQSGKTRLLEILETLVHEPWLTGRVTAAVLIRKIDAVRPTLLLDESDTAFGGEKEYAEALRGVLNSGYRRGGKASCCVGQGANTSYKDFETFCAKAIAGIGSVPDTVADRSIPIRLKRATRGEVERFRRREADREASDIKARLAAWCAANVERLRDARPQIPAELSDRQADCCEPLLAVADLAGGEWPDAARRALVELCAEAQADDQSRGVQLLSDIRQIFDERGIDRISSADLVVALTEIETSPWAECSRGKPLTKAKLARLLGRFGIAPGTIRVQDSTPKGYYRRDFNDAFARYLPRQDRNNATKSTKPDQTAGSESATAGVRGGSPNSKGPSDDAGCGAVAVSASVQTCGSNGQPVHTGYSND